MRGVPGLRSFQLARISGIRVGVDLSWFAILFIFVVTFSRDFGDALGNQSAGFAMAVAAAILFFGSILLHELGHAFAARRQGIGVSGIRLFFFGGVMQMDGDPDTPRKELIVSAAGPAVTALIALAGIALGVALAGSLSALEHAATLDASSTGSVVRVLVGFLVTMNVWLLGVNLIPAYPLDGGRIFRALVWRITGDRTRSLRVAARVGQAFCYCLIAVGLYLWLGRGDGADGIWLMVLGWMLGGSARAAEAQTTLTDRLDGVTVADVMDPEPVTIPAELKVSQAWEEYFLRYQGWAWFAVVEADGRFAGLAHRAAVEHAAEQGLAERPVRDVTAGAEEERVDAGAPLEALLGSEALRRSGALMALDPQGRLRGVVTFEQVSRALQARLAPGRA
jgi:Zn-dependent protease